MLLSFGIGMALKDGGPTTDWLVGLSIVALLHSAGTIQNDIEDLAVDRTNKRGGALQNGSWAIGDAKLTVWWLTAVAGMLALLPSQRLIHVSFAAALVLIAWAYNCRPLRLSHRPLLSIAALGLYYGAVPLLYGCALGNAPLGGCVAVLGLSWFAQRASISMLKDFIDAPGDKRHGKRTFYLRYGKQATAYASIALGVAGYATVIGLLLLWLQPHGLASLAFIVAGLLALRNLRWRFHLLGAAQTEAQLGRVFKRSFAGHNQFEAALLVCLLLS
jgi:4-hydroxybenzoate polyprenyltransferase